MKPFRILRALVPSDSGSDAYTVTLDSPAWLLGHCSCPDFRIRIESRILAGEKPPRWTCKHIDRVAAANARGL